MTWPVAGYIGTHVAGSGGDPWQTMWRFEHKAQMLSEAVQAGSVGTYVAEEFFGRSQPALVNLSVWPWMWVQWLFGQPLAYNIVWLLSFILSGYAVFLLVGTLASRNEKLPEAAAFIAGMTYMFLPYHVAHAYGHFGAMQLQWIPFIIVLSISFIRKATQLKVIGLAALLIVQGWTEHHYFLWLMLFATIAAVYYRADVRTALTRRTAYSGIGILLIAGSIIFLSYLPTIRLALQADSSLNLGYQQLVRFSADPFAYVVPAAFHSLWGQIATPLYADPGGFTGNISEATQFIGFIVLLLIAFFHQQIDKRTKWFWNIVVAIFFIISLGPRLHIFGTVTILPLPYEAIDSLPVFSSIRAVARAGALVGLAATVLFGLVLATQLKRRGSAVAVGVAVLIEFLFLPVPIQSTKLSAAYEYIAADASGTVLEIPAATNYTIASRALYASNKHHKEVLGNIALERALDDEAFVLAKQLPGVRQIMLLRTTELREDREEFFGQSLNDSLLDAMDYLKAANVVVHTDSLSALQNSALETFLAQRAGFAAVDYDDVRVFTKPASQHGDGVLLMRGEGWMSVGFDKVRSSVFAEVPEIATVTLINTTTSVKSVIISFQLPPENTTSGQIWIDEQQASTFDRSGSVSMRYELLPGEHQLLIQSRGPGKLIIQNPVLTVESR